MSATQQRRRPRHNVLLTHPRTTSHLLTKLLNLAGQDGVASVPSDGYFFLPATAVRFRMNVGGKDVSTWNDEERHKTRQALQDSYGALANFMNEAEQQGKSIYVKEHVLWMIEPVSETMILHPETSVGEPPWTITPRSTIPASTPSAVPTARTEGNETCLPDAVLKSWKPTFLIRHPALAFPSLLRTSRDNEGYDKVLSAPETYNWEMTYHWSRTLYTWYTMHLSASEAKTSKEGLEWPIILDADDLANKDLVKKYADIAGLDSSKVRYEWPAATEEELALASVLEKRMKDTILKSTGVVAGKTAEGLDLEREKEKWREEFGEVVSARLERWVEEAMEDYLFLREKRLR